MENRHIIKDTSTLQKFVRVNVSVIKESFLPFELDAQQKYILPYLGEVLHKEILTYLGNESGDNTDYPSWADTDSKKAIFKEVIHLTRAALAKFTLYLAAPHFDLHLSEAGFIVTDTTGSAPASAERVRKLVQAYLTQGYDSLETLLRYLEKHHQVIDSYKDSEALVIASGNLINSAELFDRIVSIDGSRRRFIQLKPDMDNIERLVIEPVISPALAEKLREGVRKKDLNADHKKLLELLQRALANLVMAECITLDDVSDLKIITGNTGPDKDLLFKRRERLQGVGNNFLAWAKRLLDKDPDKYPEYKNSDQFVQNRTYSMYQNTDDDDNRIFVFGQP